MLPPQRIAHQRYPELPDALPNRRSLSTFYPRTRQGVDKQQGADKPQGSERAQGRTDSEGLLDNRLKSLKEFIDVYFEEDVKPNRRRMPIIRRRSQIFQSKPDRKASSVPKPDEDLTKSVAYDALPAPESFLPAATTLRWSVSAMEQLPSIHEQTEGCQEEKEEMTVLNQTSQLSFLRKTSSLYSSQLNPEGEGEQRTLTFENELFCVYVLVREGKAVGRVKEFKERGVPFMEREARIKNYGIISLWRESKYNHRSFSIGLRPPIKDQLARMLPDEANPAQLKMKQRQLHVRLVANHCQEMSLLLRNICLELKKVEGRVLNNKINPSNLFLRASGVHLAEWAYSSFREEFTIREGRFEKRRYGVLRGEDWFVSPEYLAPEIVRQLLGEDVEVWGGRASADVWSLGLSFFEMITLIPVWVTAKCSLIHRPAVLRSGVLAVPGRDLQLLLKKQATVQRTVRKLLSAEVGEEERNEKLFEVIGRMVEPELSRRISLDDIISSLS